MSAATSSGRCVAPSLLSVVALSVVAFVAFVAFAFAFAFAFAARSIASSAALYFSSLAIAFCLRAFLSCWSFTSTMGARDVGSTA